MIMRQWHGTQNNAEPLRAAATMLLITLIRHFTLRFATPSLMPAVTLLPLFTSAFVFRAAAYAITFR